MDPLIEVDEEDHPLSATSTGIARDNQLYSSPAASTRRPRGEESESGRMHITGALYHSPMLFNDVINDSSSPSSASLGEKYLQVDHIFSQCSPSSVSSLQRDDCNKTSHRDTNSIHANERNFQSSHLHSQQKRGKRKMKPSSSSSTVTLTSSAFSANDLFACTQGTSATAPTVVASATSSVHPAILPSATGTCYTSSSYNGESSVSGTSSGVPSPITDCFNNYVSSESTNSPAASPASRTRGQASSSSVSSSSLSSSCSPLSTGAIKIPALDKYNLRTKSIQNRLDVEKKTKSSSSKVKAPKPKAKPAPLSKYRRKKANTKERTRMQEMNDAFERLRSVMPEVPEEFDCPSSSSVVSSHSSTSHTPGTSCKCKSVKSSNNCKNRASKGHQSSCCKSNNHSSHSSVHSNANTSSKSNLTKITTLKLAVNYIAALTEILKNSESTANDVSMSLVAADGLNQQQQQQQQQQLQQQLENASFGSLSFHSQNQPLQGSACSSLPVSTGHISSHDTDKCCSSVVDSYDSSLHQMQSLSCGNRYLSASPCVRQVDLSQSNSSTCQQQQQQLHQQPHPVQDAMAMAHTRVHPVASACASGASATTSQHLLQATPQHGTHHLASPGAYNSSSPAPSSSNSSSWLSDWDPFSSPVGAGGGLTPDVDSLVGDVCDTFDLILESDEFQ